MGGSMIKRFYLALAIFAGLLSPAYSAGTISFSLSQQFDSLGKPLAGCKLYFFAAGTSTPQIAYQDTALTLPVPGGAQITCDAAGRLPQFFLADGLVKVRLTDKNGVNQGYPNGAAALDNLLVIGPSSGGGGGGGTVDPTTVLATGDIKSRYGTGVLTGWVRMNGRTIGSATSGATERANSDAQALFEYLWGADANLVVSTGRGASANADWVANKTIALPDGRGRILAGLDDMGNSSAGRLTASYFGSVATTLGASGGFESQTLSQAQLPALGVGVTVAGNISVTTTQAISSGILNSFNAGGSSYGFVAFANGSQTNQTYTSTGGNSMSGATGPLGSGAAHPIVPPMILVTNYIKL